MNFLILSDPFFFLRRTREKERTKKGTSGVGYFWKSRTKKGKGRRKKAKRNTKIWQGHKEYMMASSRGHVDD